MTTRGGMFLTVLLGLVGLPALGQTPGKKPNVVLILADNVGHGRPGHGGRPSPRRSNAAHRPARPRGSAPYAVSGRAWLHAVARGADDPAVLDPQRALADHRSGKREHALAACGDNG